jgi:hypothetical protein
LHKKSVDSWPRRTTIAEWRESSVFHYLTDLSPETYYSYQQARSLILAAMEQPVANGKGVLGAPTGAGRANTTRERQM